MTSNVIDDLIISASWDEDHSHVNFRLTIDVFRQLISALNHSSGRWAVCDNLTPETTLESTPEETNPETTQTAQAVTETPSETSETASEKGRRPNQNLTNGDAKRVYNEAKKHPELSTDQLDVKCGLYVGTIRQSPKKFYLNETYPDVKLSQIVKIARFQMDRFSGETFTGSDVADWGISSEFTNNDY